LRLCQFTDFQPLGFAQLHFVFNIEHGFAASVADVDMKSGDGRCYKTEICNRLY
jgi:hypothetical protein